jgi:hypothetical protein
MQDSSFERFLCLHINKQLHPPTHTQKKRHKKTLSQAPKRKQILHISSHRTLFLQQIKKLMPSPESKQTQKKTEEK